MSLRVKRHTESGVITEIQTNPGVFSYSYLAFPRPEGSFGAGNYGTEFIIHDEETLNAIREYLSEKIKEGQADKWKGKFNPKTLNLPLRKGDDDNELEAGKWVLKTSTQSQPKLFILNNDTGRAHEVEEDELDEIYSGMEGEIIFSFYVYSYLGKNGVKAYINAACKTGTGTPIGSSRTDYVDAFSTATDFDTDVEAKPVKKSKKEEVVDTTEYDLDDMLGLPATTKTADKTSKTKAKAKVEEKEDPVTEITLDDLIK